MVDSGSCVLETSCFANHTPPFLNHRNFSSSKTCSRFVVACPLWLASGIFQFLLYSCIFCFWQRHQTWQFHIRRKQNNSECICPYIYIYLLLVNLRFSSRVWFLAESLSVLVFQGAVLAKTKMSAGEDGRVPRVAQTNYTWAATGGVIPSRTQ